MKILEHIKSFLAMKWTGRKLGSMLFFALSADVALATGKLTSEGWVTFSSLIFVTFVVGNVVDKKQGTDKPQEPAN